MCLFRPGPLQQSVNRIRTLRIAQAPEPGSRLCRPLPRIFDLRHCELDGFFILALRIKIVRPTFGDGSVLARCLLICEVAAEGFEAAKQREDLRQRDVTWHHLFSQPRPTPS